jgi:hypothetical protein
MLFLYLEMQFFDFKIQGGPAVGMLNRQGELVAMQLSRVIEAVGAADLPRAVFFLLNL